MPMTDQDDEGMRTVSDQAAEWFIRLRDRDLTMTERRKYVRWLKQSPNHIAEFMRLCRLYGRVKRAKLPPLPPEVEESNVIALMQREPLILRTSAGRGGSTRAGCGWRWWRALWPWLA